jgi:hypothetical protein
MRQESNQNRVSKPGGRRQSWLFCRPASATRSAAAAYFSALALLPAWAAPATEVLVTTTKFGDIEFDWGRDGVHCPTCNGGAGNARFNWVSRSNELWIAQIDFNTGAIYPPNGRGVLVDTSAAYFSDFGNGPEWVFWQGDSQLIYTRYTPGAAITPQNTGIGLAKTVNGSWSAGFIPGGLGRITPGPSQSVGDAVPLVTYASGTDAKVYWRELTDTVGAEQKSPWLSTGLSVRWVPNTSRLVFVNGATDAAGGRFQQVFEFDTATNAVTQLTFDATEKRGAFMFPAPEFGGDMVFFTVSARTKLQIFRFKADSAGVRRWTLVKTVTAPSSTPYIATPEPFIHNGRTWIYMTTSSSKGASDITVPTRLAITGIDPAVNNFRMLVDSSSPVRLRQDPEYFITALGPFLYYSRAIPGTATAGPVNEGVYRIDLGLGPRLP